MASSKAITMGIIVGNRGFFPGHLAKSGREEIIAAFKLAGITPIVLSPDESRMVRSRRMTKRSVALNSSNAMPARSSAS